VKKKIIDQPVLVVVGPTAIGKTDLSLTLAHKYQCEIVSVDSMQVYRHMDIGTAKASLEERSEIPHHLIDIVDPDETYDATRFVRDALQSIHDIHSRGKLPLLTGGTGLYLRSLFEGIFPGVPGDEKVRTHLRERLESEGPSKLHEELSVIDCISAERIHQNDSQRLIRALEVYHVSGKPWSEHLQSHREQNQDLSFSNVLNVCLTCDRKLLYERINMRCELMVKAGLETEVKKLLAMGYSRNLKSLGSIGYKHMIKYIKREWSYEEMLNLLARDTRRYAKRQYTWFSRSEKMLWLEVSDRKKILNIIDNWYSQF